VAVFVLISLLSRTPRAGALGRLHALSARIPSSGMMPQPAPIAAGESWRILPGPGRVRFGGRRAGAQSFPRFAELQMGKPLAPESDRQQRLINATANGCWPGVGGVPLPGWYQGRD